MASANSKVHDFYEEWLGIPPGPRPPDYYTLLGLERFESDAGAIQRAAMDRTKLVRTRCLKFPDAGTQLLNELATARICLTDPAEKQRYDQALATGFVPPPARGEAAADDHAAIDLSAYREMVNVMPAAEPPGRSQRTPAPLPTPPRAANDEGSEYEIASDSDVPDQPLPRLKPTAKTNDDDGWTRFDERVRRRAESTEREARRTKTIAYVVCGIALVFCLIRLVGVHDGQPAEPQIAELGGPAAERLPQPIVTPSTAAPPAEPPPRQSPTQPGRPPDGPLASSNPAPTVSGLSLAKESGAASPGMPAREGPTPGTALPPGQLPGAAPGAGAPTAGALGAPGAPGVMSGARPGTVGAPSVVGAWTVPQPVNGIVSMPPRSVVERHGDAVLPASLDLIRAADGKMLEIGVYHLFEIASSGSITLQWKGRATGNKHARLSIWNGQNWAFTDLQNYSGATESFIATPPLGERSVFLMVNCTSGSIATDFVGGIVWGSSPQQALVESKPADAPKAKEASGSSKSPSRDDPRLQGKDDDWYVVWVRGQRLTEVSSKQTWVQFIETQVVHGRTAASDRLSSMQKNQSRYKIRRMIGQGVGFRSQEDAERHKAKIDSNK